jgi:glutamate dehydrogenase
MNQRTLFDENYALASTQALKNKDIPEDGAKGTILPSYAINDSSRPLLKRADTSHRLGADPRLCFEKYIDVRTNGTLGSHADNAVHWYRLS